MLEIIEYILSIEYKGIIRIANTPISLYINILHHIKLSKIEAKCLNQYVKELIFYYTIIERDFLSGHYRPTNKKSR